MQNATTSYQWSELRRPPATERADFYLSAAGWIVAFVWCVCVPVSVVAAII